MGFLGKVGRGLKRAARNSIVRGALSAATGGLSEKAINIGKQLGVLVKAGKPMRPTKAQAGTLAKASATVPTVPAVEFAATPTSERKPIWAPSVGRYIKPGLRERLPLLKSSPSSRSAAKRKRSAKPSAPARPTSGKPPAKRKTVRDGSKPKRKLSPGMQARADHTKAMAKQWAAEGKPGKFFAYLKSHPYKG